MLDQYVQKISNPMLNMFASRLKTLGVRANHLTLGGFALGIFGSILIAFGRYHEGLAFLILNRIADGLDGARARLDKDVSARGGFLDILCDFIFYASVPLAFAIAAPADNALVASLVLFSFIGTGSSFLAYANFVKDFPKIASSKDDGSKDDGSKDERSKDEGSKDENSSSKGQSEQLQKIVKALHYIGGLTEASETMIFFLLICLFPQFFPILGVLFALLCLVTTGTRAYAGWRDFGAGERSENRRPKK